MEHRIRFEGGERVIDIRPMDETFIVYRKMYVPPLTPENIAKVNPGDWVEHIERFQKEGWQKVIEEFLRKQTRLLGSCAILAWDGDGVIGKLYFTTREMWEAFCQVDAWMCVEHESMPRAILAMDDDTIERLLASPSRTLHVQCMNIGHFDARYQGQGIASAMLEVLKDWARERAWRTIEMPSCPDVVPEASLGGFILRRSTLERRGFRVARQSRVSPREAEMRRADIERILSGELWPADHWYMKIGRRNIEKVRRLAQDPSWTEVYDQDYVMACDL